MVKVVAIVLGSKQRRTGGHLQLGEKVWSGQIEIRRVSEKLVGWSGVNYQPLGNLVLLHGKSTIHHRRRSSEINHGSGLHPQHELDVIVLRLNQKGACHLPPVRSRLQ
jgi:hypothetical protein